LRQPFRPNVNTNPSYTFQKGTPTQVEWVCLLLLCRLTHNFCIYLCGVSIIVIHVQF